MMSTYSIIKLQLVRKRNLHLLVLLGLLSCQQIEAMEFAPPKPSKPGRSATPGKENADVNKQLDTASRENVAARSQEQQGRRMAEMRLDAARRDNMASGLNGSAEPGQQVPQASPAVKGLAKRTAESIATTFIKGLSRLGDATGLRPLCNRMIGKPLMDAWLKARQLDVKNDASINLGNDVQGNGSQQVASTVVSKVSPNDIGLMNQKIDNIIDSVVNMYNEGLSTAEIGTFVKNSVQLALVTPVIGMGAGAGAFVGGISLGTAGAVGGFVMGAASVDPLMMAAVGPAAVAPPILGGFVGGAYGAGVGAFEGASAGARYTSKVLQSPGKGLWQAAEGNAPEYLGNKYFNFKSTAKDGNKQPNPKKQTNNTTTQQATTLGNNSQTAQPAA